MTPRAGAECRVQGRQQTPMARATACPAFVPGGLALRPPSSCTRAPGLRVGPALRGRWAEETRGRAADVGAEEEPGGHDTEVGGTRQERGAAPLCPAEEGLHPRAAADALRGGARGTRGSGTGTRGPAHSPAGRPAGPRGWTCLYVENGLWDFETSNRLTWLGFRRLDARRGVLCAGRFVVLGRRVTCACPVTPPGRGLSERGQRRPPPAVGRGLLAPGRAVRPWVSRGATRGDTGLLRGAAAGPTGEG